MTLAVLFQKYHCFQFYSYEEFSESEEVQVMNWFNFFLYKKKIQFDCVNKFGHVYIFWGDTRYCVFTPRVKMLEFVNMSKLGKYRN